MKRVEFFHKYREIEFISGARFGQGLIKSYRAAVASGQMVAGKNGGGPWVMMPGCLDAHVPVKGGETGRRCPPQTALKRARQGAECGTDTTHPVKANIDTGCEGDKHDP